MKIIHLSDLHIGRSKEELRNFETVMEHIAINDKLRDIPVVITGDITDDGRKRQFKQARSVLKWLDETNRVLIVAGNHDYAWKGNIFDARSEQYMADYLGDYFPVIDYADGLRYCSLDSSTVFIGIDSGDPDNKVMSARGYISERLANSLGVLLKKCDNNDVVIGLHHHPFTDGFFTALNGSELFLNVIKDKFKVLLFGHDHSLGEWHGVYPTQNRPDSITCASHKITDRVLGRLLYSIVDTKELTRSLHII